MRLVSPLLKHVIYPGLSQSGYLRKLTAEVPAVLTYHGVFPEGYEVVDGRLDGNLVSAGQLRAQLRFLKRHYELISPEDFLQWCERKISLPPRAVLLTCDDGLRNNFTVMLPVLQECGANCLFFVTGACAEPVGSMLWHEQLHLQLLLGADAFTVRLSELGIRADVRGREQKHDLWRELIEVLSSCNADLRSAVLEEVREQLGLPTSRISAYLGSTAQANRFQTMNLFELRQLANAGMCIGAHTLSHSKLSRMSDELVIGEIQQSRQALAQALGQEIWAFAYPFGDPSAVGAREIAFVEDCGFTCAFLNVEAPAESDWSLFALPRVHVTKSMNLSEIEARISGFHASLRQWLA